MTMTLEIPSDLQAQIEQAATLRGTDAQAFVIEATKRALEEVTSQQAHQPTTRSFGFLKESRHAAIKSARGSLCGLISSDDFLAERHAGAQREREKEETNWNGNGNTP